ncbi:MAG TPA: TetR/AcrR family transcriptional regulator [Solirubrobacteraceae bacterium]
MDGSESLTASPSAPLESTEDPYAFDELPDADRVQRLIAKELGGEAAAAFERTREAHELWERQHRPAEGLRERKKRLTRKRISDIATTMFLVHGFDNVKVSDIARLAGVSEKTVFNYFSTKESMVFDEVDEGIERLASALRSRAPGESPTRAVVRALQEDIEHDVGVGEDFLHAVLPRFLTMLATTPALRAAWLDLHRRFVTVAMEELAALVQVDPYAPEPMIAARALVGLHDIALQARVRWSQEGLRGREWGEAVLNDVERAARLLDTGLWSFGLLAQGARTHQQLREAAKAAEDARVQVVKALRQARSAWRELRRQERG